MNGKSDRLIPTVPILFVLLSIIVSRYYKPMSWLPHITLGKTLTKEQMQMAFSVMQESFVPFEATITEIGLARVNPHSDVVRWKLKQQQ